MERVDILDDFINSALGVWGVEIVIDAAEEAPVPVAPAYGPYEKAFGLTRWSDHEMFGDMHDSVIGREFGLVKDEGSRKLKKTAFLSGKNLVAH
jgi:hypothetical protein